MDFRVHDPDHLWFAWTRFVNENYSGVSNKYFIHEKSGPETKLIPGCLIHESLVLVIIDLFLRSR